MVRLNLSDEAICDFVEARQGYRPTDAEAIDRCRRHLEGSILLHFRQESRKTSFSTFFETDLRPDDKIIKKSDLSAKQRRLYTNPWDTGHPLFELAVHLSTDDAYQSIDTDVEVRVTYFWRKDVFHVRGVERDASYVERCRAAMGVAEEAFEWCDSDSLQHFRVNAITGQLPKATSRRQKLWLFLDGEEFARCGSMHDSLPSIPASVVADIGSFFHGQDSVLANLEIHRWTVVGHGKAVVVQLFPQEEA